MKIVPTLTFPENGPLMPTKEYRPDVMLMFDKNLARSISRIPQGQGDALKTSGQLLARAIRNVSIDEKDTPALYLGRFENLPRPLIAVVVGCVYLYQKIANGSVLAVSWVCAGAIFLTKPLHQFFSKNQKYKIENLQPSKPEVPQVEHESEIINFYDKQVQIYTYSVTEHIVKGKNLSCLSHGSSVNIQNRQLPFHSPIFASRAYAALDRDDNARGTFVSTLTTWAVPRASLLKKDAYASPLFNEPFTRQLNSQIAHSMQALVWPDSKTQASRAIMHGWDMSWHNRYRSGLACIKTQDTGYLHAISVVVTNNWLFVVSQGDCMAHLFDGNSVKELVRPIFVTGWLDEKELVSLYEDKSLHNKLPLRLIPDSHAAPTCPQVLSLPRSTLDGMTLVLSTPGLYDTMVEIEPGLPVSLFKSLLPDANKYLNGGFRTQSFSRSFCTGALTLLDISKLDKGI
jgi:hypothetical protein